MAAGDTVEQTEMITTDSDDAFWSTVQGVALLLARHSYVVLILVALFSIQYGNNMFMLIMGILGLLPFNLAEIGLDYAISGRIVFAGVDSMGKRAEGSLFVALFRGMKLTMIVHFSAIPLSYYILQYASVSQRMIMIVLLLTTLVICLDRVLFLLFQFLFVSRAEEGKKETDIVYSTETSGVEDENDESFGLADSPQEGGGGLPMRMTTASLTDERKGSIFETSKRRSSQHSDIKTSPSVLNRLPPTPRNVASVMAPPPNMSAHSPKISIITTHPRNDSLSTPPESPFSLRAHIPSIVPGYLVAKRRFTDRLEYHSDGIIHSRSVDYPRLLFQKEESPSYIERRITKRQDSVDTHEIEDFRTPVLQRKVKLKTVLIDDKDKNETELQRSKSGSHVTFRKPRRYFSMTDTTEHSRKELRDLHELLRKIEMNTEDSLENYGVFETTNMAKGSPAVRRWNTTSNLAEEEVAGPEGNENEHEDFSKRVRGLGVDIQSQTQPTVFSLVEPSIENSLPTWELRRRRRRHVKVLPKHF